jgi:hypothetical protein
MKFAEEMRAYISYEVFEKISIEEGTLDLAFVTL